MNPCDFSYLLTFLYHYHKARILHLHTNSSSIKLIVKSDLCRESGWLLELLGAVESLWSLNEEVSEEAL